jgi:hypothetical protein
MGSTEQQLAYLTVMGVDVSSYSNILLSFGFIVFAFAFSLIYLWEKLTDYPNKLQHNGGYTEVNDRENMLDASSSFLDDEDEEAVELKDTTNRPTI